jgi:hypothetical protein
MRPRVGSPRNAPALGGGKQRLRRFIGPAAIAENLGIRQFCPWLVEETALMLTHQPPKPVYLSRMMGGAAKIIIYHPPPWLTRYLEQIGAIGADRLAAVCGLTAPQLSELFDAQNLDTIVRLTALGVRQTR